MSHFLGLTQSQALALKNPIFTGEFMAPEALEKVALKPSWPFQALWIPATALSVQLLVHLGLLRGRCPQCCSQEVLPFAGGALTVGSLEVDSSGGRRQC